MIQALRGSLMFKEIATQYGIEGSGRILKISNEKA